MKNQTLRIEPPKLNIGLNENDNSYIIRGNGPDGYINQTVLKEDPDCRQKVQDLLSGIYEHQAAELADFVQTGPDQLDSQYQQLLDTFSEEFESNEDT